MSATTVATTNITGNTDDSNGEQQRHALYQACQEGADLSVIRNLVYDECERYLSGRINLDLLVNLLSETIKLNEEIINLLSDLLLLIDLETQNCKDKTRRDNYINLLAISSNKLVSDTLLKVRLDFDTTGEAQIIADRRLAHTKFIKLKTRLFYKQQKFNLFREESEGYAKLITELLQEGNLDVDYMLDVVKSLIGCFNLDPNRVIDVILECFECRIELHKFYIELIRRFFDNKASLTQIIAFKFNFYHNRDVSTNSNLYQVASLLITHKLIELDDIWEFLLPTDMQIEEFHHNELEDTRKNSRKMTSAANDEPIFNFADKLEPQLRHSLIDDNQKLNLALHLLKVGDWKNALVIIDKLPEFYALSDRRLALELSKIIHFMIDDVYKKNSTLPHSIACKLKPYHHDFGEFIVKIKNLEELKEIVFTLLNKLGPFVHHDVLLIVKIVRVGRSLMCSNENKNVRYDLIKLLDECILPSMSFIDSNYSLSEEVWQLLKCFSYSIRYTLYHNLKNELPNSTSIRNRSSIVKRIKYIMKRLTKENVRLFGRHIGKLTHSNPSILFEYILSQVQSYDNLINPVVDSFKYLTSMSYDVLVYCIVECLSDPAKAKTEDDGVSISQWLLSLATFCGAIVKKYPVELPGLLQFIANQLKMERSLDLFILKEIIQKMAGICTDQMTDDQLLALSGGEVLKNEGGYFNQVRNTRKPSIRLKEALLEANLAVQLCILIAQQRNCIVFVDQDHSHLKLIGKLYDQCQETLVQYGSFLSSNLSMDDYIGGLPSLDQLIQEYYLSSDVAFFLIRSMITYNISLKSEELYKQKKDTIEKGKTKLQAYSEAWESVFDQTVESMSKVIDKKLWNDLSPKFFVTFWTLTTYDLEVPVASYEKEIDRLHFQIQNEESKEMAPNKKKKEIERCRLLQEKLLEEQLKQDEHVKKVHQMLDQDKNSWFQLKVQNKMEMITQFLQHCLLPRCIFTPNDAIYCAEFVHLIHTIKTPNFSTLICYDRIFGDISYTISSFTENEANNFGRFLCSLLKIVMTWHRDKNVYEKECAKFPGFVSKFCDKDPVYVDYENYRHVCHKWHYKLTKAFITCLDSGEYLQIRNALIVLTRILPYLPVITSFALAIEKRVDQIREKEKDKRKDLFALATGYAGQLKQKKSSFISEDKFHIKASKETNSVATTNNGQSSSSKKESDNGKDTKKEVKSENSSTKSSPISNKDHRKESNSNSHHHQKISPVKVEQDSSQSSDANKRRENSREQESSSRHESSKSSDFKQHQQDKEFTDRAKKEDKNGKSNDISKKPMIKSESRSATNSPKRDHQKTSDPNDSDREHKKRKSEIRSHNHISRDKEHEKRKSSDNNYMSNKPFVESPLSRSHATRGSLGKSTSNSSRKRELNGESPSNDSKRRRDEDLRLKKMDERKEPSSSGRSSRRESSRKE